MEIQSKVYLRELIRLLVRNLGLLEKIEASCCEITISQCHAIVEIGRIEKLSLNELAELLQLDKSTISRTINNLVDLGLVQREVSPEDRRYITINLTKEGKKIYKNIEDSMDEYYLNIFNSITEEKRSQVLESLELLTDAIKNNKCF
ncbi:DNA-binding MarR family transcriptional regulator [Clostridium punense]|uniref:DNA-binding MarR family transcriptional regulator n=1 Tax=Clostridium punense TaxID=1054297 RepID=A0ABS4K8N2_9CLOT|nr:MULTISPECIES: MarR family transcriptional regulator [Clostridium]EQB87216.1 hypothetical protein M918_10185 [Clostridium sp. BL8]MBP2023700.1 DNA-binding MarR family transcriptional regulator [Clostridium punense]